MKKIIITFLLLGITTIGVKAQYEGRVGVNTSTPAATLEVKDKATNVLKGVLLSRVTSSEMKTMTYTGSVLQLNNTHNSLLVYLKDTLPVSDRSGALVNVSEPGYYYYDSLISEWRHLLSDSRLEKPQFYMPSVVLPLDSTPSELALHPDVADGSGDVSWDGTHFNINLYNIYRKQYTTMNKSLSTATLTLYTASELDYYVLYNDTNVFDDVSVSNTGLLKYKVRAGADPNEYTYMNIMFKVK